MSTPWKILVLASRDAELVPLRQAMVGAGRPVDLHLVRSVTDAVGECERLQCDAALVTLHVSHLHLAQVLAELHRREPLFPVLLVGRAAELAGAADLVRSGLAGAVFSDMPELLVATLEREIQRHGEAQTLRQREQRLHGLEMALGVAPIGLAIVDTQGCVRWANPAYRETAGITPGAIEAGRALLWPGDDERWPELRGTLRSGRPWRGVEPGLVPGATGFQLAVAELSRGGEPPWYVVVRQAMAEGGGETAEHWATTRRHELFAAIAGGIAHDLNNILAPITMAASLLEEQALSPANDELVRTIEHNAERGAAVIRQVLTFARGSDNCELLLQPRYLLREVARLAAEVFPPNIDVHAELPAVLAPIVGDPAEIHQALVNVLLNARDALPEGGHIAIAARNVAFAAIPPSPFFGARPGEFVEITIKDTGAGPDPEVANRVWEPFVTTKGGGQGAGLGLARVAGVLRSHGGFALMQGGPELGTTISLYFPRATDVVPASLRPENAVAEGEGGRILIVDDESEILALSRQILERAGYEVLVASEGREALGVFMRQRTEISLVLTDLAMPGMNGFTLLWALRRAKPDLRVMVATGQGTEANLRELGQMGVHEVLLKPFTAKVLLGAVARALAEPVHCEPELYLDAALYAGPKSAA